ncbi:MAG: hypothetical protein QHH19_01870 [Candidatus Thermoplasmatota archaeon]|nr:hypothetical protein [Candidatus Thermoplasmatota archaeon]
MIIPTVIGGNTSLESDGESPNNMLGISAPSYNMCRKIINLLSKININTDILRFLLGHQTVCGFVSYSDGSNIPNGVPVTITDLNNGNSATRYTQQSTVYGPGFYQIDVIDLGANQGDIIFANVSYGGCTGNGSVAVDFTGPPHTLNFSIYGNLPPAIPSQPSGPTTGNKNIQYNYSTSTTDPENEQIYYLFDWGDGTNSGWIGPYSSGAIGSASHSWNNYGTYQVKAKAKDIYGAELGICWSNPLNVNIVSQPPNTPNTPSGPTFLNAGVSGTYSTNTSDPDGDQVQYRFDWDANGSHDYSDWTSFVPSGATGSMSHSWSNGGTYVVKAQARDAQNMTSDWSNGLTVFVNSPPYIPSDPDPENGSINIDVHSNISWTGGDPDGDTVTYDVYFEADDPTPDIKIAEDIVETWFEPGKLEYETTYYWKVYARDSHGAVTQGPIWSFTTELTPEPDLNCYGSLSWTAVPPGGTVNSSFTVENIGEPDSLLDWEVIEWPDWGTWSFDPINGYNLKPEDGAITVNVTVVAPDEKNKVFTGEIKIVNKENVNDFEIVTVSLTTPRNKIFYFEPFEKIIQRFPALKMLVSFFNFLKWLLPVN